MRRLLWLSLLSVWASACATTQTAAPLAPMAAATASPDAFRAERPPSLEREERFDAPVPTEHRLTNGLRVLVTENHALPLVSAELLVMTGVDGVAPKHAGLAGLTARMLSEGTRSKSATQLAEALEDLAIGLSAGAGADHMAVSLDCLKETLPQALDLFSEVVREPAFRAADWKRVQSLALTALEQKLGNPDALASDAFAARLYGPTHPWGQPSGGTPKTVKSIRVAQLAAFHRTWFKPNHAVLAVAGDVTPGELIPMLEARLSKWKPGVVAHPKLPPFPSDEARNVTLVDQPQSTQSFVWVGGPAVPSSHPDALALRLANFALGGLFSSRLNSNLREAKGYSYGYFSRLALERDAGAWVASGPIKAEETAAALGEIEAELARFARGDITDSELAQAKLALVRGLPAALETNDAVASAMARLVLVGLPLDYYRTLNERVSALTRDDVARVTRTYLRPEQWPIALAGPRARIEEGLRALNLGPLAAPPESR